MLSPPLGSSQVSNRCAPTARAFHRADRIAQADAPAGGAQHEVAAVGRESDVANDAAGLQLAGRLEPIGLPVGDRYGTALEVEHRDLRAIKAVDGGERSHGDQAAAVRRDVEVGDFERAHRGGGEGHVHIRDDGARTGFHRGKSCAGLSPDGRKCPADIEPAGDHGRVVHDARPHRGVEGRVDRTVGKAQPDDPVAVVAVDLGEAPAHKHSLASRCGAEREHAAAGNRRGKLRVDRPGGSVKREQVGALDHGSTGSSHLGERPAHHDRVADPHQRLYPAVEHLRAPVDRPLCDHHRLRPGRSQSGGGAPQHGGNRDRHSPDNHLDILQQSLP